MNPDLVRSSSGPCVAVDLPHEPMARYRARFANAAADDLATPKALATA